MTDAKLHLLEAGKLLLLCFTLALTAFNIVNGAGSGPAAWVTAVGWACAATAVLLSAQLVAVRFSRR